MISNVFVLHIAVVTHSEIGLIMSALLLVFFAILSKKSYNSLSLCNDPIYSSLQGSVNIDKR